MVRVAASQILLLVLATITPAAGSAVDPPFPAPSASPPSPTATATNFSFDFTGVSPARVQSSLTGSDPQYNRQEGDCGGLSGSGTAVYYETITIANATDTDAVLTASTSNVGDPTTCGIDTFMAAYTPSFSAGNSSSNCVASNDDAGSGLCSAVTFALDAGQSVVVVVSPYANGVSFSYQVNFSAALQYRGGDPTGTEGFLGSEDGTYNRQAGDCGGLSGIGTAVYFDTALLTNATEVDGDFSVSTSDPGDPSSCAGGDTFLSVYSPTFDPSDPASNCLTSNDDSGPGVCSALSFALAHEKTVTLVITSFGNGATFPYGLNIKGPIVFRDGFESGNRSHWSVSVP